MSTLLKNGLLDLPQELLTAEILGRSNFRDVLHCSMVRKSLSLPSYKASLTKDHTQTCKFLRDLIKATSALQLKIELGADGIIDTMTPFNRSTSSAERVQAHLDRRRRWRSMSISRVHRFQMSRLCDVYEYLSGVFAQTDSHERREPSTMYSSLTVLYPPSLTQSAREIFFEDIGIWVAEITFDPAQDVLALVERRGSSDLDSLIASSSEELLIHLRTLTTNRTHPLAAKPIFGCLRPDTTPLTLDCLRKFEIFDDMLALLVESQNTYVRIWNWKSGEVIFVSEF